MDTTRCKYPSKLCHHERSRKDDGSYHRFCDFHRTKANNAQRRWHARNRQGSVRRPVDDSRDVKAVYAIAPQRNRTRSRQGIEIELATTHTYRGDRQVTNLCFGVKIAEVALPPCDGVSGTNVQAIDNWMHLDECVVELDEIIVDDERSVPEITIDTPSLDGSPCIW